ncbi:hypothetical protein [Kocuria sp. CPCC 205297]|uniref:hypothetical protein n=1 Tax=Kocuria sp. CPCC 205297 TaxID=3073558 RepID=UPI0034D6B0B4
MSIIYTRHQCRPDEDPEVTAMAFDELEGATWKCPECQAYWELQVNRGFQGQVLNTAWFCIGRPLENQHTREIQADLKGNTPTITPRMIQIVLDTYEEHRLVAPADGDGPDGPLGHCGECDAPIGPHTSQTHAMEAAVAALQAEIDGDHHDH